MHMTYSFDVSQYLEYGTLNSLVIRVLSPLKSIENVDRSGLYPTNDTSRLLVRKSQMNYGWDFCGYCLTTGIWKDVYLLSRTRSEEHTSELQSRFDLVCRLLLEKKNKHTQPS